MESEADTEASSTPKLSLYSLPIQSPEPAGMLTPPLRPPASVPFRWEEAPGKPRSSCTTTTVSKPNSAKCLELPPRLLTEVKITNMPSPTTVLEGPYVGRSVSYSVSFSRERQRSFGSPERGQLGSGIHSTSKRGYFGSWRRTLKGNKQVGEDNFVISSCPSVVGSDGDDGETSGGGGDTEVKISRIRRNGSFLSLSNTRSYFWASIYGTFKQVVPWRSRKIKKSQMGS